MPELPEVERLVRSLRSVLLGRTVVAVAIDRRDVVVGPDDPPGGYGRRSRHHDDAPARFPRLQREWLHLGATLSAIERRGKQLAIIARTNAGPGHAVVVHLGMSGQLIHRPCAERFLRTDHIHARWTLDDGSRLAFRDPRRFGGIWTYPSEQHMHTLRWNALGPDALTITPSTLSAAIVDSRAPIKARLLDQKAIAGVGNIYADESLHAAGLSPTRPAASIPPEAAERLAHHLRRILADAIEAGGSTLRDYADANGTAGSYQLRHRVYARAGLPCLNCGSPLQQTTIAQRTTVWCPRCQP